MTIKSRLNIKNVKYGKMLPKEFVQELLKLIPEGAKIKKVYFWTSVPKYIREKLGRIGGVYGLYNNETQEIHIFLWAIAYGMTPFRAAISKEFSKAITHTFFHEVGHATHNITRVNYVKNKLLYEKMAEAFASEFEDKIEPRADLPFIPVYSRRGRKYRNRKCIENV